MCRDHGYAAWRWQFGCNRLRSRGDYWAQAQRTRDRPHGGIWLHEQGNRCSVGDQHLDGFDPLAARLLQVGGWNTRRHRRSPVRATSAPATLTATSVDPTRYLTSEVPMDLSTQVLPRSSR